MPAIHNISVKIDPVHLLRSEGYTDNGLIIETAAWAAQKAIELVNPNVVYRQLPVRGCKGKRLNIGNVSLSIGSFIGLLQEAQQAILGVVTVGATIEAEIYKLQKDGLALESYILGCAAFAALDATAMHLKSLTEKIALERNWGVSPALSPGALPGWPTSDQSVLCSLLKLFEIGVEMDDSGLLSPKYSLSLLIGIGPGYRSHKVEDNSCRYCSLNKRCPYRFTSQSHSR